MRIFLRWFTNWPEFLNYSPVLPLFLCSYHTSDCSWVPLYDPILTQVPTFELFFSTYSFDCCLRTSWIDYSPLSSYFPPSLSTWTQVDYKIQYIRLMRLFINKIMCKKLNSELLTPGDLAVDTENSSGHMLKTQKLQNQTLIQNSVWATFPQDLFVRLVPNKI